MNYVTNFNTALGNQRLQQHPFDICSIENMLENEESNNKLTEKNDLFRILWITKGNGYLFIDLDKSPVNENALFFIKPEQAYSLSNSTGTEGYLISFTENFLNSEDAEFNSAHDSSLFQLFADIKTIVLAGEDLCDLKAIVKQIIKEFNSVNMFRNEMLKRYFRIFLIYLTRQMEGSFQTMKQTRNIELVQKFLALLEKNYKEKKMVSDYAVLLSVTPNYLNEIIKKTTGHSAGHHIRQRIVLEAKRKAAYSDTCMKEIAYYLGFCDMAHFSKFFKNAAGMNFTEFKKEHFVFASVQA